MKIIFGKEIKYKLIKHISMAMKEKYLNWKVAIKDDALTNFQVRVFYIFGFRRR